MAPLSSAVQHLSWYRCMKATLEARGELVKHSEMDQRFQKPPCFGVTMKTCSSFLNLVKR